MNIRETFLRGVWKQIPDEEDTSWVERVSKLEADDGPLGDYGPIVKEMLDKGISKQTIARFAKIVGYETAFGFCYLLGDPSVAIEKSDEEGANIDWALFEVDVATDTPTKPICGLYESLLSLDPSDREMRPQVE